MFYKVIFGNMIVDVLERLNFVRWQKENRIMISCGEEKAQGILSSDASVIWHLEGLPDFNTEGYDTVRIAEIEKSEYESLKEQLGIGEVEEIPVIETEIESDTIEEPTAEPETVILGKSTTQLLIEVQKLNEKVDELKRENELLSDCLLELSEVIYA